MIYASSLLMKFLLGMESFLICLLFLYLPLRVFSIFFALVHISITLGNHTKCCQKIFHYIISVVWAQERGIVTLIKACRWEKTSMCIIIKMLHSVFYRVKISVNLLSIVYFFSSIHRSHHQKGRSFLTSLIKISTRVRQVVFLSCMSPWHSKYTKTILYIMTLHTYYSLLTNLKCGVGKPGWCVGGVAFPTFPSCPCLWEEGHENCGTSRIYITVCLMGSFVFM